MMSVVVIFAIIIAVVSLGAFVSGRRFGVLALSLAAGSILSEMWVGWLASLFSRYGLELSWMPIGVLAAVTLLIAPLLLLLFNGPKYSSKYERVFSALATGFMTAAFLVEPFGQFIALEGEALEAYLWLSDHWRYVITAGLVLGLVDLFLMQGRKSPSVKSKKH